MRVRVRVAATRGGRSGRCGPASGRGRSQSRTCSEVWGDSRGDLGRCGEPKSCLLAQLYFIRDWRLRASVLRASVYCGLVQAAGAAPSRREQLEGGGAPRRQSHILFSRVCVLLSAARRWRSARRWRTRRSRSEAASATWRRTLAAAAAPAKTRRSSRTRRG